MSLSYAHLLGREFVFGEQDCFSIIRDFYTDNFGITMPNYARPNEFWKHDMDMYRDRYIQNGFEVLHCHPSEYQEGDIILMAISSSVGNHAAILVEDGRILHHMWGKLSAVDPYRDIFRNTTVGVFRHKDVVVEKHIPTTNMEDYVNDRLKKILRDANPG